MQRRRRWQWVIRPSSYQAMPEGGFAGVFSQPSSIGCIEGSGKSEILR
jgi:hypothetical protein